MPASRPPPSALRTTDSVTKVATTTVELPDADGRPVTVTVSGIAKGVGMIHPNMATMLSIVLTDAAAEPETLWVAAAARRGADLGPALGRRRHQHQRHGVRAGLRASGAAPVRPGSSEAAVLGAAIEAVARDLARQQAADGEGAATLITAVVTGAADDAERPGRGPRGRLVEPGQGGRPRPRPQLGPDRGCGRQRAAGRCRGPRGRRAERRARRRSAAAPPAVLDPDRLRIAIAGHRRVRRDRRRPARVRPRGGARGDGRPGGRDRARPRPGRRHRRGLRLRPHRGVRDRELASTRRERGPGRQARRHDHRRPDARSSTKWPRSRGDGPWCSSTAAASASPSGSSASASRAGSRAACA